MQSFLLPYRPAEVYTGKNYWYVYYHYVNPATGKLERLKEYWDINRIHDRKEKRMYAQEMVRFINQKLKMGFNPFEQMAVKEKCGNVIDCLDTVYSELMLQGNDGMKQYYKTQLNRFKKYLEVKVLQDLQLSDINLMIAENFKQWMQADNLSKKTVNANLSYMSIFWQKAKKMQLTELDPFKEVERVNRDIRKQDDEVEDLYEPITMEELTRIVAAVKGCDDPQFLAVLMLIYYAWIRPIEIRKLRVGDIDLVNKTIKLKKGNTKNNRGAFVQIVPALLPHLQCLNLEQYPKENYLFSEGSPLRGERGNSSYLPGELPVHKSKFYRTWVKVVKEGLGIDKNMYALKHTGNIEYLQQNKGSIDLKWQQMQNRHSSITMTERYNRQLGAYFIDVANVKFRDLTV